MANAFIAQGVAPIQVENPLNQMARLYAVKGAQQEQAMREQTMAEQNALRQLLATNPNLTSGAALNQLARIGPTGLVYGTKLMDIELERGKQRAAQFKLTQDKTAYFRDALNDVNTPEAARQWTAAFYSDPDLAPSLRGLGKTVEQAVSNIPTDPEGFQQWKQQQTLGATEFLKLNKPTYMQQDFGADTRIVSLPGLGGGGMTVVPGTAGAKTTPEYQTQRLAFDQAKFEWEKRNPGFSIIEAETGFFRVNKNTGQAFPITFGEIQQSVTATTPTEGTPVAGALSTAVPGQLRPAPKDTKITIGGEKLTPLQEAADKKFSDDYVAWKAGGGTTATKNIAQIKSVMDKLHNKEPLTGPMTGIMPDVVLAFTNPNSLDARQRVEQVAQESLRTILGAQFTQKEGENFIARVYDPKLSPEKNASRLRAMFMQLETAANQKQAMVDYADKHGTLRGYTGTQPSINDFYEAIQERPPKRTGQPATSKRNEVDTNNPLLK